MSKKAKTALILVANIILFLTVYLLFVNINPLVTLIVYTALTAGFVFTYVIYNRGFSRRNVTPEMLPAEWSYEQKCEFIEDGKRRLEKSKWMLLIILPLIVICGYELFDIYLLPMIKNLIP